MMLPHDVILATDKDTGRSLEFIGLRGLTAGYLDEQVGAVVCRDGLLADNVVETEVKFVEGKHLREGGLAIVVEQSKCNFFQAHAGQSQAGSRQAA